MKQLLKKLPPGSQDLVRKCHAGFLVPTRSNTLNPNLKGDRGTIGGYRGILEGYIGGYRECIGRYKDI